MTTITNPWMLLVGAVATIAICYQNVSSLLAYGWALVHGAGPAALLAFVPLAAGLALLWGGYLFLRRQNVRRKPLMFAAYACIIVLLNEIILPNTARQASAAQTALLRVRIGNIRDELVLSTAGNPIGVRLTFEAVVPQSGSYAVSPAPLQPDGESRYPFQLGRGIRETVEPAPVHGEFRERVPYTFSKVFLPNFLSYDERTAQPCFNTSVLGDLAEDVFVTAVLGAGNTRLRAVVQVGKEEATQSVIAAEYVTQRTYDLGAFYQTIVTEGNKRCSS